VPTVQAVQTMVPVMQVRIVQTFSLVKHFGVLCCIPLPPDAYCVVFALDATCMHPVQLPLHTYVPLCTLLGAASGMRHNTKARANTESLHSLTFTRPLASGVAISGPCALSSCDVHLAHTSPFCEDCVSCARASGVAVSGPCALSFYHVRLAHTRCRVGVRVTGTEPPDACGVADAQCCNDNKVRHRPACCHPLVRFAACAYHQTQRSRAHNTASCCT